MNVNSLENRAQENIEKGIGNGKKMHQKNIEKKKEMIRRGNQRIQIGEGGGEGNDKKQESEEYRQGKGNNKKKREYTSKCPNCLVSFEKRLNKRNIANCLPNNTFVGVGVGS